MDYHSATDAKKGGSKFYLGLPCPKGHTGVRYASTRTCRECNLINTKTRVINGSYDAWRKNNKQRVKDKQYSARLKRVYDLDEGTYNKMLIEQDNKCKICSKSPVDYKHQRLCIDHCHTTGKVRGLLCNNCNAALGQVNDSISTLEAAITYLKESKS